MSSKISFQHVKKHFSIHHTNGQRNKHISQLTALQEINLDIQAGEFMVLVGPSGCGKSTLLDLLSGLSRPSSGQILMDGKPIEGPALDRGIVFQQYALFPWRTTQGNVEFGLEAKGVSKQARARLAREYISLVGLSGFEDHYPHQLSGGMKQRVAIARSLVYNPAVLLMDEPFAALDAQTRDILQSELLCIWEKTCKTVVFITHSIDEAVYLGQRVAVMTSRPGRIKRVVNIPLSASRYQVDDLRSNPNYVKVRHEVWSLLCEEVQRTQQLELVNSAG